ncbi:Peptidase family M48 [Tranquillimonas rosea]|uniref:Peptidase family M48 n=1 Tax=Tranquillimonas rosea TaxID=641238 RepID=A0A1H9RMS6_9RHOB|nr:M48 family metalloprotease [Tranquillimonas rosea]SER74110.1 Peptidase family M48 [Tranquillimonas rosea]
MRWAILGLAVALAGCAVPPPQQQSGGTTTSAPSRQQVQARSTEARADRAASNFFNVITRVEPVAEQECRRRTGPGTNCDFAIVVDDRVEVPPNAFQTVSRDGRPVVGFTISLIAEARNRDELAFILGHEAAHHISGHLDRSQANAMSGAILAGALATLGGAGPDAVRQAQSLGATMGARRYSKGYELEADALGTVIAARAGYDPVVGAQYFARSPDPGNSFLGTHPPNSERIATVRRIAAGL